MRSLRRWRSPLDGVIPRSSRYRAHPCALLAANRLRARESWCTTLRQRVYLSTRTVSGRDAAYEAYRDVFTACPRRSCAPAAAYVNLGRSPRPGLMTYAGSTNTSATLARPSTRLVPTSRRMRSLRGRGRPSSPRPPPRAATRVGARSRMNAKIAASGSRRRSSQCTCIGMALNPPNEWISPWPLASSSSTDSQHPWEEAAEHAVPEPQALRPSNWATTTGLRHWWAKNIHADPRDRGQHVNEVEQLHRHPTGWCLGLSTPGRRGAIAVAGARRPARAGRRGTTAMPRRSRPPASRPQRPFVEPRDRLDVLAPGADQAGARSPPNRVRRSTSRTAGRGPRGT